MENYDYIIIGQGLAGTLLAYFLIEAGQRVLIIDNHGQGSASKIAAGVINPITGRRIVKSWRIDEFLPFAKQVYQDIETKYGISIWQDRTIIRTFKNAEDENEWLLRSAWSDYRPYCNLGSTPSVFQQSIKPFYGFGEIIQAAQVNIPVLVDFFRKKWEQEGILIYENWQTIPENIDKFAALKGKKIIFCEGANGALNPYFKWLPFNLDKGELLIVKIPNLNLNSIFKNNISLVPLGNDLYWVGATNEWNSPDDKPTEAKKQLIVNELRDILQIDFDTIDHKSALRPTVQDRRPFIGFHPKNTQMAIFNGFGTKGASLIPYWAAHFRHVIVRVALLDKEVDIKRFEKRMKV
jgi:glycine oxidase